MFTFIVPAAEFTGLPPELNASNAHVPLQLYGISKRLAGISAGLYKMNRPQLEDGSMNPAFGAEAEVMRGITSAQMLQTQLAISSIPQYAVDLRQTDAETAKAFLTLMDPKRFVIAETDSEGVKRSKAVGLQAQSKVVEVITK